MPATLPGHYSGAEPPAAEASFAGCPVGVSRSSANEPGRLWEYPARTIRAACPAANCRDLA